MNNLFRIHIYTDADRLNFWMKEFKSLLLTPSTRVDRRVTSIRINNTFFEIEIFTHISQSIRGRCCDKLILDTYCDSKDVEQLLRPTAKGVRFLYFDREKNDTSLINIELRNEWSRRNEKRN